MAAEALDRPNVPTGQVQGLRDRGVAEAVGADVDACRQPQGLHNAVETPTGEAAAAATPIFWGHGRQDGAIPFSMAVSGRQALTEAGIRFTTADFDIGHWIVPEEVEAALALVEQVRSGE